MILHLLICSFLPCLSWLLRSGVRKSRRDLWVTLYFGNGWSFTLLSVVKSLQHMYSAEHGFWPVERADGRTGCGEVTRGGYLFAWKFIVTSSTVHTEGEKGLDQTRHCHCISESLLASVWNFHRPRNLHCTIRRGFVPHSSGHYYQLHSPVFHSVVFRLVSVCHHRVNLLYWIIFFF